MQNIKKYFMTLALLITAVGGAWAEETPLLTIESKDYKSFTSGSKTFDDKVTVTFSDPVFNDGDDNGWYAGSASLLTVAGTNGYTITSCKFYTDYGTAVTGYTVEGESPSVYLYAAEVYTDNSLSVSIGTNGVTKIEVYGTAPATEWSLTPDETGKTWTLAKMPASNIELQVEYFAESNLFLSKDALADQANISVKNGETTVEFGDDGKSTTTVTEGNTVTAKFTGKKVLGMEVKKKAALKTFNCDGTVLVYEDGDTWADVIARNPDKISQSGNLISHVGMEDCLQIGENFVYPDHKVDPNANYKWEDG